MDTTKERVSPPRQRMQLSWTDPRFRGLVWQVVVVGLVAGIIAWLWRNTVHNLDTRHISTGFGFLSREAGMPIADALIAYRPSDTYLRALIVGVLNTLRVAVIGVVLATILGTLIGIARLSKNWLLAKLAAIYVETLRDLRAHDVDVVTIGQYLQPSPKHATIDRWVHPDEFKWFREQGEALGFGSVFSGPLVRSSYRADEQRHAAATGQGAVAY